MKKPISVDEAFARVAARCARQECCRWDIGNALQRWGLPSSDIEKTLMRLEAEGYIDEQRYAKAFVHDKSHYDRWGPRKIQAALQAKRIANHDISTAINALPQSLFRKNLSDLLATKARMIGVETQTELSEEETLLLRRKTRERLLRFALSRGYDMGMALALIDEC
ncbi:MAG: RecX family transcriptional regulator [Bacteroidaceae bacterium]|nr:RecX family transcriptional regulator [Bacteroidaceae bacterium]